MWYLHPIRETLLLQEMGQMEEQVEMVVGVDTYKLYRTIIIVGYEQSTGTQVPMLLKNTGRNPDREANLIIIRVILLISHPTLYVFSISFQ